MTSPEQIHDFMRAQFPNADGIACLEVGEQHAVARWTYDSAGLRPGGLISGPTIFALADTALYFAVFGAIGIEPMAVTADLSIAFLRPARGGDLLARADLSHIGPARIHGSVDLWVDGCSDRPVARATGTYARPRK